jgi:hypothetical protein
VPPGIRKSLNELLSPPIRRAYSEMEQWEQQERAVSTRLRSWVQLLIVSGSGLTIKPKEFAFEKSSGFRLTIRMVLDTSTRQSLSTRQESGNDLISPLLHLSRDLFPSCSRWLLAAKHQLEPMPHKVTQPSNFTVKYPLIPCQARAFLQGGN